MDFNSLAFFVDDHKLSSGPTCEITELKEPTFGWPTTLTIRSNTSGTIKVFLKDESQLIQFVNSTNQSYNRYRKDRGYDKETKETSLLSDEELKVIKVINQMDQKSMASLWRFAPVGHPYFDKTKPYFKVFEDRFKSLGGFTPTISKSLG